MRDLLCIGTLAIDRYLFVRDFSSTLREGEVEHSDMKYGGGCANTTLAARKLGLDADLLAPIGDDITGTSYSQHLAANGVFGVVKKKGGTPLCTYIINKKTEQQKGYWYLGVGILLKKMEFPNQLLKNFKIVHLSQTPIEVGMKMLKKKITLSYNPGPPIFQLDLKKLKKVLMRCKYIFVNESEFSYMTKNGITVGKLIDAMPDSVIIVTRGDHGSEAYSDDGVTAVKGIKTKYVETNGAGDALIAGFFKGLMEGKDIRTSLEYGNTVSSFVIEKIGCQTNHPTYEQMKRRWKKSYGK